MLYYIKNTGDQQNGRAQKLVVNVAIKTGTLFDPL